MANKLLFKTSTSNDSSYLTKSNSTVTKAPGTVYFTKDGKIVYDLDSSTRLIMSDNVSYAATAGIAEKATGDKNGKDITTYMAYAKWDTTDNTTLHLQNSSGTNIFSAKLADKFLPLVAGLAHPLTGDLYISAGNEDRFLHFSYTGTGYDWRIGYLGSGTGNANYLVFQSNGTDGVTWTNALRFGLTDLNATFGGSILPSATGTKDIGSSSLRWKGLYGQTLNIIGNATIGDATTDAHTIKGTITQTGNIIPGANATYNLGSTTSRWKALYVGDGTAANAADMTKGAVIVTGGISASKLSYFAEGVTISGVTKHNGVVNFANGTTYKVDNSGHATFNQLIAKGAVNFDATAIVRAINPETTNTYTLGTSDLKWKNIYATTFNGNLSGTATKAKQDQDGRVIDETYIASLALSDYTLTAKNGDGTIKTTINVAPTNSNGIIPLKHIPATAIERVIVVTNQTARFALTTDEVQNGDVVKENDTGIMYFVSDDTNLNNESGYQEFHAGMSAWAKEADYAAEAGRAKNDSDGNKISTSYIKYPFTLNADKTQVTIANGVGTKTTLDYNYYPTAMTWTGGTSAGPTATIDMAGTTDIAVGAIPTATASASGVVIVGTQTFGGAKIFNNNVTVQKILAAGDGTQSSSTTTGAVKVSGGLGVTKNTWIGGTLNAAGATALSSTLNVTGATTLSSTLNVTGATTLTGKLTAKGAVQLGDAESDAISIVGDTSFTNDVTIGKTLTVTGAVTTKGTVTLGDAESDTVTVNGDALFKNDVTITKTLTVSKQVKVGDGTDISTDPCDLEVVGGVDVGKNLRVTGGTADTATIEFKQEAKVVYDSAKNAFNFVFN